MYSVALAAKPNFYSSSKLSSESYDANSNELVDAVDLGDSNPGILRVKNESDSIALSKLSAIRRTLFSGVNEYVHRTLTTAGGTS